MDRPSSTSRPTSVSSRPHWTVPVSREETLARREQFRKVGWRPPNYKRKTTKNIAWAKSTWDRYVTHDDLRYPSTIRARVTDSMLFRHCEHLGVDPEPTPEQILRLGGNVHHEVSWHTVFLDHGESSHFRILTRLRSFGFAHQSRHEGG
jgi:hypothetical protein